MSVSNPINRVPFVKYRFSKNRVEKETDRREEPTRNDPFGAVVFEEVVGKEADAVRDAFFNPLYGDGPTEDLLASYNNGDSRIMYCPVWDPVADGSYKELQVCKTIHAAIQEWCHCNGHVPLPLWADLDNELKVSTLQGMRFHIANPDATDADSHNNWMATRLADGWVYGEKKCPVEKIHPCLVPFEKLPLDQQVKDGIFRALVHAMKVTVL